MAATTRRRETDRDDGDDDDDDDDVFERGFRVDCGRTAAEEEEKEEREGRKRDRVTFWDFSRAI